jgi:hypothetical protein
LGLNEIFAQDIENPTNVQLDEPTIEELQDQIEQVRENLTEMKGILEDMNDSIVDQGEQCNVCQQQQEQNNYLTLIGILAAISAVFSGASLILIYKKFKGFDDMADFARKVADEVRDAFSKV